MSDFNDLKIGDKVIVQSTIIGSRDAVGVVEKTTKARLYVHIKNRENYIQFWRKNGNRVGDRDRFHSSWIIRFTDQHFEKIEEANYREDFIRDMRTRKWHNCPTSTMKLVAELIQSGESANGEKTSI